MEKMWAYEQSAPRLPLVTWWDDLLHADLGNTSPALVNATYGASVQSYWLEGGSISGKTSNANVASSCSTCRSRRVRRYPTCVNFRRELSF